jgi:hypothetical protein
VEKHFAKFITLFRKNENEWKKFLFDRGVGDPPIEYKIAIEEGTRYYFLCPLIVCGL